MLSFPRKQESIFFCDWYYPFWIPASLEMTEWVIYALCALRYALCSMPNAFQGTDITSRCLFTHHFPHLNEEGVIFVE